MGDKRDLTDEDIRTTWRQGGGSAGLQTDPDSTDPDSKDADGTDGDSGDADSRDS